MKFKTYLKNTLQNNATLILQSFNHSLTFAPPFRVKQF